jgi:hypothetical protein
MGFPAVPVERPVFFAGVFCGASHGGSQLFIPVLASEISGVGFLAGTFRGGFLVVKFVSKISSECFLASFLAIFSVKNFCL